MKAYRRVFFEILAPILIILTIYISWEVGGLIKGASKAISGSSTEEILQERVFLKQAQVLIGAQRYLEEAKQGAPAQAADYFKESLSNVRQVYYSVDLQGHPLLNPNQPPPPSDDPRTNPRLVRKEAVLAAYFGYRAEAQTLVHQLGVLNDRSEVDRRVDELLAQHLEPGFIPGAVTAADYQLLRDELKWFGDLFILQFQTAGPERQAAAERIFTSAKRVSRRFVVIGVVGSIIFLASVSLFVTFIVLIGRGLKFRYRPDAVLAEFGLEVFCLYLAGMLLCPRIVNVLLRWGMDFNLLAASLAIVIVMAALILWPSIWGVPLASFRRYLGLYLPDRGLLRDLILGPTAYIGSICVFLVILAAYSALLFHLHVNVSSAAHPVVPLLLGSSDKTTTVMIVILAVVAAPIVEEIMFRGALYSWLRARTSAVFSIVISSLIFASVHPQGPIGILPLAVVGVMLSFLREWRGSLAASMAAHACFNAGTLIVVTILFSGSA